ncbi:MAG: SDR family NAD(P)-dependent oxidoreductase [Azospirillaceae bacterium]|nr:SDR family NAD(P)-dependent oxidoreductase [Azospirillaceae bacterium]
MNSGNKIILITGSTDGVGRRVAERLGTAGNTVLIHGRDAGRAESLRAAIETTGGKAVIHRADFASLDQVRALAEAVARDYPRLDLLINNAGIGTGRPGTGRELSRDGHELRLAVNHLAGFLLTRLLLPGLVTARGRIVNVASAGQEAIDFDDVMLARGYSGGRAYRQSKLAQIMVTFDLATELRGIGITVNALHPASYMNTTMVRRDGIAPLSSVDEGADAILDVATSPQRAGQTGLYLDGRNPARAHAQAYDTRARARLHALSLTLVGLPAVPPAQS